MGVGGAWSGTSESTHALAAGSVRRESAPGWKQRRMLENAALVLTEPGPKLSPSKLLCFWTFDRALRRSTGLTSTLERRFTSEAASCGAPEAAGAAVSKDSAGTATGGLSTAASKKKQRERLSLRSHPNIWTRFNVTGPRLAFTRLRSS